MSLIFKKCSALLYLLALLLLINGLFSYFYKETIAISIDSKETMLLATGSSGKGNPYGSPNGYLKIKLLSYYYETNKGNALKGYWLLLRLKYSLKYDNLVFYNQLLPFISVKEKGISIFWVSFFLLFGFLSSQISVFFNYLNQHT